MLPWHDKYVIHVRDLSFPSAYRPSGMDYYCILLKYGQLDWAGLHQGRNISCARRIYDDVLPISNRAPCHCIVNYDNDDLPQVSMRSQSVLLLSRPCHNVIVMRMYNSLYQGSCRQQPPTVHRRGHPFNETHIELDWQVSFLAIRQARDVFMASSWLPHANLYTNCYWFTRLQITYVLQQTNMESRDVPTFTAENILKLMHSLATCILSLLWMQPVMSSLILRLKWALDQCFVVKMNVFMID